MRVLFVSLVIILSLVTLYGAVNVGQRAIMDQAQLNYYSCRETISEIIQLQTVINNGNADLRRQMDALNLELSEIDRRLERISNTFKVMAIKKTCKESGDNEQSMVSEQDFMGQFTGPRWAGGCRAIR